MYGENILTMYLSFTIQISKYLDPTDMKIFFSDNSELIYDVLYFQ